ncbi:MAG TPA: YqjK family protein [Gallionella sp.]|nr:YqjK family protein [Gallionella sp.]
MNSQLSAVMQRRGELLASASLQREQLVEIGACLQQPLALADRGVAVARFLRSHPVPVAAVISVLVIRRRGVTGAASVVWRVWKRYRYFTAIAAKLLSWVDVSKSE